jgi:hypothetical protein
MGTICGGVVDNVAPVCESSVSTAKPVVEIRQMRALDAARSVLGGLYIG